jgi:DNA-directed RNA polymerase specialized sigma subunit
MTTKSRPKPTRSTKIRAVASPCPDQGANLGSFPPPTPWSEQLAADNLRLAAAMAHRLAIRTRMPFDDLYLVAAMGLLKGCRRYDPELINPQNGRPYQLSTYLVPCIRGAMAQWLRDRGHSSGVKFPDRWRDVAPTVRRLAAAGASMAEVVSATGLSLEDVQEILQAQSTTTQLDPDALRTCEQPQALDEAETYSELADALHIADRAWEALPWADRQMIEQAWQMGRRKQLAALSHQQFLGRAKSIIRRQPLEVQSDLTLNLPESKEEALDGNVTGRKRKLKAPTAIIEGLAEFFGGGKTLTDSSGVSGATADQPPNN